MGDVVAKERAGQRQRPGCPRDIPRRTATLFDLEWAPYLEAGKTRSLCFFGERRRRREAAAYRKPAIPPGAVNKQRTARADERTELVVNVDAPR